MTPKEKAEELCDKFHNAVGGINTNFYEADAVKCALICADEILEVIKNDLNYQNVYAFYLDVKEEINKL